MPCAIDVSLSPADYSALRQRDISDSVCVVFDVLRATSVMATALSNGAAGIIPVLEISEALELRRRNPAVLLAGERSGLRITAKQTGDVGFDLGNSPREYTKASVEGRTIVCTTTNGTRALSACSSAQTVIAASFLNLTACVQFVSRIQPAIIHLICAGTGEACALEDVLAAGAFCETLIPTLQSSETTDAAQIARWAYRQSINNLHATLRLSLNGRRLYSNAELREDIEFCLRQDCLPIVPVLGKDGVIKKADQTPFSG